MWTHPIFRLHQFIAWHFIFFATKSWIGAVLAIGGSLISAYGQKAGADAQADQMEFNARQTALDAAIAKQNAIAQAQFIRSQGAAEAVVAEEEAGQLREAGRQLVGRQRTQYAKAGVRMSGTPLEVIADTITNIELDAIKRRQAGLFKEEEANWQAGLVERGGSFAYSQGLASSGFQSGMAGQTSTAGTIGAISTLMSGASTASTMFS